MICLPERRSEHHQQGEDFKQPKQHGKCAYPGLEVGENYGVSRRRADQIETGAGVAEAGGNRDADSKGSARKTAGAAVMRPRMGHIDGAEGQHEQNITALNDLSAGSPAG